VEETVIETASGTEFVPDPKSVPSANELVEQLEQGVLPMTPEDNTDARGVVRPTDATAAPAPEVVTSDAPLCMQCGVQMIRAGSCHACPSCGSTSGCS
jgi:ribonucleoside-diphosphate reductase alpha chain